MNTIGIAGYNLSKYRFVNILEKLKQPNLFRSIDFVHLVLCAYLSSYFYFIIVFQVIKGIFVLLCNHLLSILLFDIIHYSYYYLSTGGFFRHCARAGNKR